MEGSRRNFLNKRSNPQFKKTGVPRKGKRHIRDEYSENSSDSIYRILCRSKKIGNVIGKGGNRVKALREETQAKITVCDSVPGSDERVIIIFSPSEKQANIQCDKNDDKTEKGNDAMKPHCAAQDALLKVHDRIVEEDIGVEKGSVDENAITARLLVSNHTVGCLLGRKGDVIQRLRSEIGANIRVLPAEHLPGCAMSNDELVQISGKPEIVRKALYEVSTLLHQNPRKDKPPSSFPSPYPSEGFDPPGHPMRHTLSRAKPWLEHTTNPQRMQLMPFEERYAIQPSRLPEDFDRITPHDRDAPSEFSIKILCSAEKIGGVIGKGGSNVRHLEQDTGASIHVENVSKESDDRVIRVSSIEALWDQRSQTIDAILHLQNRTCQYSEKGMITTKLLVPSSKVGCILGQGGHVINDMRRRTGADIRVFSKEDKPKCALQDEELVQITGSVGVAKDALVEIASRLRTRCLHDANTRGDNVSVRTPLAFDSTGNFRGVGLPPSSITGAGSSGRYEHLKGSIRELEPATFPVHARPTSYLDVNEAKISSISATAGSRVAGLGAPRLNLQDPYSSSADFGTPEHHLNYSRNMYQMPASSAGLDDYPQLGGYRSYNLQQQEYSNNYASPVAYHQNSNSRPAAAFEHNYTQQDSYQNIRAQDSYRY